MEFNIQELSVSNYVRKGSGSEYFSDLNKNKLDMYKKLYGDEFNIIIHNISEKYPLNFYVIPYSVLKYLLIDEILIKHTGKNDRPRWILSIKHNEIYIRNCSTRIYVGNYFANPNPLKEFNTFLDDEEDYAIENKVAEIKVRVKQSVFRKRVLENFNQKCCLTGIEQTDLLVASHIVPWKDRIETRLSPSNGLCLFVTYDKLFDEGYISFSNDLKVIITPIIYKISGELKDILENINNKQASKPKKFDIKPEFLDYHRDFILKK